MYKQVVLKNEQLSVDSEFMLTLRSYRLTGLPAYQLTGLPLFYRFQILLLNPTIYLYRHCIEQSSDIRHIPKIEFRNNIKISIGYKTLYENKI